MKLTRKKAIALCIEAWTIHAKTGCEKYELPEKHRGIYNICWFCEYGTQQESRAGSVRECCEYCPLWKTFKPNGCYNKKCYYSKWSNAKTPRTRKKYAKLFLKQIKSIEQRN